MDVIMTFLTRDIDEEIYMKQSEGFEQEEDLVCKIKEKFV